MKVLLGFIFAVTCASTIACPDLSGEFVNEEFGTYYSISQNSCDLIQYHFDEGTVDAPLDGKEYLINDYDIVVEEGKVLAHVSVYSSHEFKGNKLLTKERSETTYTSGGVDHDAAWSEGYLNKATDLVTVSHSSQGIAKNVDKRVK
jgi:hypothetical protein